MRGLRIGELSGTIWGAKERKSGWLWEWRNVEVDEGGGPAMRMKSVAVVFVLVALDSGLRLANGADEPSNAAGIPGWVNGLGVALPLAVAGLLVWRGVRESQANALGH
jgi:hypothetical protein